MRHGCALRSRVENMVRQHEIDVPACFIAGASDWGVYQRPGDYEVMRLRACTNFRTAT